MENKVQGQGSRRRFVLALKPTHTEVWRVHDKSVYNTEFGRISKIRDFFSAFLKRHMCLFTSVWVQICVDACGGELSLPLIHGGMVSPWTRSPPSVVPCSGWPCSGDSSRLPLSWMLQGLWALESWSSTYLVILYSLSPFSRFKIWYFLNLRKVLLNERPK